MKDELSRIYLQCEVNDDIQQLGDNLNEEELKRYEEVEEEFEAKNPAEIDIWETVWDTYDLPYDTGIPETRLYSATAQAAEMRKSQAKKAVKIGKEFDNLIEDEPVEPVESDGDGEATVLRPPLPEERPDMYLNNAEQFANRDVWKSVWKNSGYDPSKAMSVITLENECEKTFDPNRLNELYALIGVGEICGAIKKIEDEYLLSLDHPDKFWSSIWDYLNIDIDEPSTKETIISAIVLSADLPQKEANLRLKQAISENKLYSPSTAPHNHYRINNLPSDEGPVINANDDGGDGNDSNCGTHDGHGESSTSTEFSSSAQTNSTVSPETTDQTDEYSQLNQTSLTSETTSGEQTATPDLITALLVLASESDANISYGGLNGGDKFEAWKYARQESIARLEIPHEALIYFAIEEEIADPSDIYTEYSHYENRHDPVLKTQKYKQAVDALRAKFDFDILCGTPGMKQQKESDISSEESEGAKNKEGSEPAGNDPQSRGSESSGTSSREQSLATGKGVSSPAQIDPNEELTGVATNPPGGVPTDEIDGIEIPDEELQSGGQDGANIDGDESRTTRFQTYEEPDGDAEGIDIDRYAVKQFVEEFTHTDPQAGNDLVVPKSEMVDVFTEWAKVNNIKLDKLSQSSAMNVRKGKLKLTLQEEYDITTGRPSINGERTRCFKCIELSDSIKELLEE